MLVCSYWKKAAPSPLKAELKRGMYIRSTAQNQIKNMPRSKQTLNSGG
jgi:hypothetical protein